MTLVRFLLVGLAAASMLAPLRAQNAEADLQRVIQREVATGDHTGAITAYRQVVERAGTPRAVAARALLRIAEAYQALGDAQARKVYEEIVGKFPDQGEAVTARARLGSANTRVAIRGDRAVWTGPEVDMFGRVSPDGTFISFTDWAQFNNLSVRDLATNTNRPVVANKGWPAEDPNWGEAGFSAVSPDGKYVAYGWWQGTAREIRIAPVSNSGPQPSRRLLGFKPEEVRFVGVRDWSPDGKLLAIGTARTDGTSQIIIARVDDGSWRVLKSDNWRGADSLFFSRDSRYVAFDLPANDDVAERDVFVIGVDGGDEKVATGVRAVADASDDWPVGWSPDGKHLLFSSDRTGTRSLWTLPVADGKPQGRPALARADVGTGISLGVANNGTVYLHKNLSSLDVKIARIDLAAGRLVEPPTHFSQGMLPRPQLPHWSPDGKYLAYQSRGNTDSLVIRSVETGAVRRLPQRLLYTPNPRWSPDGRSIVVGGRDGKGRDGIFKIDAETGELTPIVYLPGLGSGPRWSADGAHIFYRKGGAIVERDLRTEVEREVFAHPLVRAFEPSPDGRFLAFRMAADTATQTSSLMVVPVAGGPARELDRSPASTAIAGNSLAWAPDGRSLLTARRSGDHGELWLVDVESGRSRRMDIDTREWVLGGGPASGFSLSADGHSIAFLMGTDSAEVWAIENVLPAR